ncbi:hypothetical protein KIN20_004797 [Parelaphostrongylus tenuis]|uniref:Uncharacterized protein n=1 Tax=Parelaphostrongylus tenuis TaxID=148309 RepID=A0AAD5QEP3_PARTN|nr:hypothetical protein KIN20_004797 [Parelaphostrongylus tenuis]
MEPRSRLPSEHSNKISYRKTRLRQLNRTFLNNNVVFPAYSPGRRHKITRDLSGNAERLTAQPLSLVGTTASVGCMRNGAPYYKRDWVSTMDLRPVLLLVD